MVIKKYIVKDIKEALEKAKKELGSDAIILSTKEIKPSGIKRFFQKPKYDVVVAYDAKENIAINNEVARPEQDAHKNAQAQAEKQSASPVKTALTKSGLDKKKVFAKGEKAAVTSDVARLEEKIAGIDQTINSFINKMETNYSDKYAGYSKEIRTAAGRLKENEVNEDLIYKLCDDMADYIVKNNCDEKEAVDAVLTKFLGRERPIVLSRKGPTVVMFLGATGVGKTTTLSKLATEFKLKRDSDIAIITTDTYKIASAEQLKVYSEILQVPLSISYSIDEFKTEFEKYSDKDLIFIDTGKCPDEELYQESIKATVEIANPDYLYIVVSAGTTYQSLKKIIDNYSYVKGYKYIVTKMDEALSCGTVFNLKSLSNKPISYLTSGQILTDDIQEYNSRDIINMLMG